jgi:hypothetical protein
VFAIEMVADVFIPVPGSGANFYSGSQIKEIM